MSNVRRGVDADVGVVVDFVRAEAETGRLEFTRPSEVIVVERLEDVRDALARVEACARDGYYAVGFISYDSAPAFDSALRVPGRAATPLLWFGIFEAPTRADTAAAPGTDIESRLKGAEWTPHVAHEQYDDAINAIRRGIVAGDFYQVNHTVRLLAPLSDSSRAMYESLRAAQPDSYSMFVDVGRFAIMSVSPELFFARQGREITTRPMKGTIARGRSVVEDRAAASTLAASEKDRAENVMIVDLVRNDLGRIAQVGSVRVSQLFEVERHPTVWQMTSTVTATLRDDATLPNIFGTLFPSGSIVGAPKIAAAEFIAEYERAPRGVYCGAMGIVKPGGDCVFNVAIRTLIVDRETGVAEYGVGGGITIDSTTTGEYDELLAKAVVLRGADAPFELFETMRLSNGVFDRRERHVRRICSSADYFDFAAVERSANDALDHLAAQRSDGDHRVRLIAMSNGSARCDATPIASRSAASQTMRYAIATSPVSSRDRFLFHKTTRRDVYESRRREHPHADEIILINERGELTECSIGNLVIELDGVKCTPPVDCGLLPGIFREQLIEHDVIVERVLYPVDLARASHVWLINSLREWVALIAL
ncbi:MAG TPA: aminodeoxychorismate synthase component I [Gemmatimonadaceae bacterium]|jgi:para-aminobenzoate synthetase/4-amino-4-deoxychorismate lyase